MGVGLRLKTALRENNMTIKEFAALSGISLNTLYSITKRDSESIDGVILDIISSTLGLSWTFFTAVSPFENLDFLNKNKHIILEKLVNHKILSEDKPLSDVSNIEYWQILSRNVFDINVDEFGGINVLCEEVKTYAPNSDIADDIEKLLKPFTQLEPGGRALVIEYAELLTKNPGFLLK